MIVKEELKNVNITLAQALALHKVYSRGPIFKDRGDAAVNKRMAFDEWVTENVSTGVGMDCLLVNWAGMTLGIEPDGHTHS